MLDNLYLLNKNLLTHCPRIWGREGGKLSGVILFPGPDYIYFFTKHYQLT